MITITHICGHTQPVFWDEKFISEIILRTLHKTKEQFIQEQCSFLESNLCPGCYCAAKEKDPNLKPVGG